MADFAKPIEVKGYIGLLQINRDVNIALHKFMSVAGIQIVAGPTWPKPASIPAGHWCWADQPACYPQRAQAHKHQEIWA